MEGKGLVGKVNGSTSSGITFRPPPPAGRNPGAGGSCVSVPILPPFRSARVVCFARAALDDGLDTLFGARAAACVVAGGGDTVVLGTGSGPRPRPSLGVERALASEASAFSDALLLQGACSEADGGAGVGADTRFDAGASPAGLPSDVDMVLAADGASGPTSVEPGAPAGKDACMISESISQSARRSVCQPLSE